MEMQKQSAANSGGAKQPFKLSRKQIYIIIAAAVLVIALAAGLVILKNVKATNSRIESVVGELRDMGDYKLAYPQPGKGDYIWGADGQFEQVRNKKKFARAIADEMEALCTSADAEGQALSAETFSSSGIERAYRMAAVLEYMNYESADVKAKLTELTEMAGTVAENSDNMITVTNIYGGMLPFRGLSYYTFSEDIISNEDIENRFNEEWQDVKKDMKSGDAKLDYFIERVYETGGASPVTVPQRAADGEAGIGSETAAAVNVVPIPEPCLDIEKMMPYDEVMEALSKYGEEAVFRNGEGGYYDSNSGKGTTCGDFRTQFISGRVKRTGEEDEFTEQYLRDHYDKPSKTNYYFRDEKISQLPPFFSDTKRVFVYGGDAYAFTDYGIYCGSVMLPYDYEAAKDAEFKHITVSEQESVSNDINRVVMPYFTGNLAAFNPAYEYDAENNLITVYLTALPGTTEALKNKENIPLGDDTFMKWDDFSDMLCDITEDIDDDMFGSMLGALGTGVGVIVVSDVNPDAGLLSLLQGEVVADHSKNPPEPEAGSAGAGGANDAQDEAD